MLPAITPPARNAIAGEGGLAPKDWYLFFTALAALANSNVILFGTHAARLTQLTGDLAEGTLYFETDRTVVYQLRKLSNVLTWVWVAGAMSGLLAARPADLGTNDTGFIFNSTDALDYRWSGAAWVALDTVRGGASLTHDGRLLMVSAVDGVASESAVTDDGTSVLIGARDVVLNNAKILKQYAADGVTLRNLLTHFSDDVVYLDNPDGSVSIRPKAGSLLLVSTSVDITGNENVSGVYKVAGTQVVGAQGAAVTSPTGGGTVVAAPSGGATQDTQARTAIVSIIAAIASTGNTVDPTARTAIDAIRARLTAHGLTA